MRASATILFAIIAAVTACGPTEKTCGPNNQCYDPSASVCTTDQYLNYGVVCPTNQLGCNTACFPPATYHCVNGKLASGPASTSAAQAASTTKASTSSVKATTSSTFKATTSSPSTSAVKTTSTPSTTKASTTPVTSSTPTTSSTPATSSSAAASTSAASSCNPTGCGSGLCNCNGACYTPGQYNCAVDVYTGKNQLCQGSYSSCNGNCFDSTQASCSSSGNIVSNGANGGGNTPASSTYPPPVVAPAPAPGNRPTQTADLRIINSCKTTLWVEGRYGGQGAPIPGQSVTAQPVGPGGYVDYTMPDSGLSGARWWAKYGCDAYGKNCLIGDAMQYWPNPPGGCPPGGCTPPVDSLFEATFGARPGNPSYAQNPTTWFDTSQVDGWTIPYKLTPNGDTSKCDCNGNVCGFSGVDASRLDLANCPSAENLVAGGQTSVNVLGQTVPLGSVDLRIIKNNTVIGCMSPCKRLNWGAPYGLQQPESSGSTMWMCCPTPTPDNCDPANGCVSSAACRTGPIENTQFVAAVHNMAPGVYSYSYDDGVGLHACPASIVTYTMEFCPTGSAQYPLQL